MTRASHVAAITAGAALAVQMTSATVQRRSFETPNTSMWIARTLAEQGKFAVGPLRAYQLPGEPLYLFAGMSVLPDPAWRYLHVPIAVLFVAAITIAGFTIGGPAIALVAGLIASVDPFLVAHGPVWDDTLLAAALDWTVVAMLVHLAATSERRRVSAAAAGVLTLASAAAALTRTQSQIALTLVAIVILSVPRLRSLRLAALCVVAGVLVALGGWGVRNVSTTGHFIVGSTHDGKTLYESNCAYSRQGIRELGVVGGFIDKCSPEQLAYVRTLDEVESDQQLRNDALSYIRAHPLDVAATAVFKLLVSGSGFDFASPGFAVRNVLAVSSSVIALAFGAWGLVLQRRQLEPSRLREVCSVLVACSGAVTLMMLAIGPTGLRYRVSFSGFLYLGIASWLVSYRAQLRRSRT